MDIDGKMRRTMEEKERVKDEEEGHRQKDVENNEREEEKMRR